MTTSVKAVAGVVPDGSQVRWNSETVTPVVSSSSILAVTKTCWVAFGTAGLCTTPEISGAESVRATAALAAPGVGTASAQF